jgi:hypothetical protein
MPPEDVNPSSPTPLPLPDAMAAASWERLKVLCNEMTGLAW